MDELLPCPVCHTLIKPTDYFCFNCGKNLRPRPLSTSIPTQIWLYLKTLLLPPLGIIWGFRYLRQPSLSSKLIGLFTIILTIAELVWFIQITANMVTTVNAEIYRQMKLYNL